MHCSGDAGSCWLAVLGTGQTATAAAAGHGPTNEDEDGRVYVRVLAMAGRGLANERRPYAWSCRQKTACRLWPVNPD